MASFTVNLVDIGNDSSLFTMGFPSRQRSDSEHGIDFINMLKRLCQTWSCIYRITASINDVRYIVVRPQDGGKSVVLLGPTSVAELGKEVRGYLYDERDIDILVYFKRNAASRESHAEQYVCLCNESVLC